MIIHSPPDGRSHLAIRMNERPAPHARLMRLAGPRA